MLNQSGMLTRCHQLVRRGRQFAGTHTIIMRLVQLIIETGVLTGPYLAVLRPYPAPTDVVVQQPQRHST